VTAGRPPLRRRLRHAVLTALLCALPLAGGCGRTVEGAATASPAGPTPTSPEELEPLVVTSVASGLPRLPDDELSPPAGEKRVDDVAAYSGDPVHERAVLAGYGFRYGWERFWGSGTGSGPVTSVFVDQFEDRAGAGAYARDLAGNDAEYYRGMLRDDAPGLPGGCRLLTVDEPGEALSGPAAFAWCVHGVFSVSVTSMATSPSAAEAEVRAVLAAQLDRLPPR
jgi:hypothetical protein